MTATIDLDREAAYQVIIKLTKEERDKMAIFILDNREAWQQLTNDLAPQYPSVGKYVHVTTGKNSGKEGFVTWHGINKFASTQFCTDAQLHLRDMEGRRGFRVCINTGNERFYVDADKVEVIDTPLA